MDWSKAKTYLIITFLLLDALLCYQWWTNQHQASVYVASFTDEVADVKSVLAAQHVQVKTDIPKDTPTLTFLRADYTLVDTNEMVGSVLHNPKAIAFQDGTKPKTPIQYQGDDGDLYLESPSTLVVNFNDVGQSKIDWSSKDLYGSLSSFISTKVWKQDSYKTDYPALDANGNGKVNYVQMFRDYPVFPASLDLNIQHGMITGYQETLLDVAEEDATKKSQVLSATSALRSLANTLSMSSKTDQPNMEILNIRLGYYGKPYNANNWYLTPMWRFVTNTKIFYVNAITGEVESTN